MPDEAAVRCQLIEQLRESLDKSREMMLNLRLDPKTRERWTQLHTNTAQVADSVEPAIWFRPENPVELLRRIVNLGAGAIASEAKAVCSVPLTTLGFGVSCAGACAEGHDETSY